jgi:hypothetical protein
MERAYRKAGRDREADDVYLSRQFVERRQKCKNHEYGAWLKSFLHWLVANYGVRPYRLIAVPIVLLVVGMIVFSRPDAARIKREPATATAVSPPATPETPVKSAPESEGYSRGGLAARLSFRIFLPVEVPLAARWEPSDQRLVGPIRFSDLATVLKIAGWILVPLGVAALTGLLRTKPSASAGE